MTRLALLLAWAACAAGQQMPRPPATMPAPGVAVSSYNLRATLGRGLELSVVADCDLLSSAPHGRGVVLRLDSHLRVTAMNAPWYQPRQDHGDWLYIELPQSLAPGLPRTVHIEYRGKHVMEQADGNDDWITPADWYPTGAVPASEKAPHFQLQATVDEPKYKLAQAPVDAQQRAVAIAVGDDVVTERSFTLSDGKPLALTMSVPRKGDPMAMTPLAGGKAIEIVNFFGARFGDYPQSKLTGTTGGALAEEPIPGLVTFSPLSFAEGDAPGSSDLAPAMEMAQQWWGAWTVAMTHADDGLITGLRQLSGLLYQDAKDGPEATLQTVEEWRRSPESMRQTLGGYTLYSLRQIMLDPRNPNPDAAFTAMMREFTAHYGGLPVTNNDFRKIAEKHMTPAMDLDRNHKLDWFFRGFALTLPEIHFHATAAAPVKGVAQVLLTVENPRHWRGLLPVYLFKDDHVWVRGLMPITHDRESMTVPAPFTPKFVAANRYDDVPVRVN